MIFISKKALKTIGLSVLLIYVLLAVSIAPKYAPDAGFLEAVAIFSSSFVWYMSGIVGFIISLIAVKKIGLRNNIGKSILILGLSSICSAVGIIIWDIYIFALGIEIPYPSIADIVWFIQSILLITGTFYLSKLFASRITSKFIITGVILMAIISPILISMVGGLPEIQEANAWSTTFFDLHYTFVDTIVATMVGILLIIGRGKIFSGLAVYIIALSLLTIGDVIFALRTEAETYYVGDISDFILNMSQVLTAVSIYLISKTFIERRSDITNS